MRLTYGNQNITMRGTHDRRMRQIDEERNKVQKKKTMQERFRLAFKEYLRKKRQSERDTASQRQPTSSPPYKGRKYFVMVNGRWMQGTIIGIREKTIRFKLGYRSSQEWDIDRFNDLSKETDIFKWNDENPTLSIYDGRLEDHSAPLPRRKATIGKSYVDENPELDRAIEAQEGEYFAGKPVEEKIAWILTQRY